MRLDLLFSTVKNRDSPTARVPELFEKDSPLFYFETNNSAFVYSNLNLWLVYESNISKP